jgi:hypothetical protein
MSITSVSYLINHISQCRGIWFSIISIRMLVMSFNNIVNSDCQSHFVEHSRNKATSHFLLSKTKSHNLIKGAFFCWIKLMVFCCYSQRLLYGSIHLFFYVAMVFFVNKEREPCIISSWVYICISFGSQLFCHIRETIKASSKWCYDYDGRGSVYQKWSKRSEFW